MSKRITAINETTCVTDNLSRYFAGKASFENSLKDTIETFLTCYSCGTFKCSLCGNIIYPKVITNEQGIYINDVRNEIRGGLANKPLMKNICERCTNKYQMIE